MPTINRKTIKVVDSNRDREDKMRHKMYNLAAWRTLRKYFRMAHPLCQKCLEEGVVNADVTIHHILSPFQPNISEDEAYRRLLDWDNLISLCHHHHSLEHLEQTNQKKSKKS